MIGAIFLRLYVRMVFKKRGVFPTGRELNGKSRPANGNCVLEFPFVVQMIRSLFLHQLVAHHASGVRLGKPKDFGLLVTVQLKGREAYLSGIPFLHFEFMAIRGNRPGFEKGNLGVVGETRNGRIEPPSRLRPD